jgi:anti-sigma regulatory factor (Ser/Thr protein kinase)
MKRLSDSHYEIEMTVSATPEAAEQFYAEVRRQTETRLGASPSFAVELLAREALTNAVVHGCGSDPQRQVRCRFRLKDRQVTIAIAHSGEGFDWRATRHKVADLADSSGRGMQILLGYSTRFRYNESGNALTILKQC